MKIAVIPARGGSKRIPRKNIKEFCGKPIIAWSIETAIKSGLFDKVVVSTDDKEIARVAASYGAQVPYLRPKELSDDYAGTDDVVKHALEWCENKEEDVEYVCCIYATAPFLRTEYLREGFNKLISESSLFSFSVTSYPFPIQRAILVNENGSVEAVSPNYISSRSQDLKEFYHDAGQFYWGRSSAFLNGEVIFSDKSQAVILPRFLVQDIDTEEDWLQAELMFEVLMRMNKDEE